MKKCIINGVPLAFLFVLLMGFCETTRAQSQLPTLGPAVRDIGIHYDGGVSYDSIASSNIGTECQATGANSFAGGFQSLAQASLAFAFGYKSHATASYTCAIGNFAYAQNPKSFALGYYVCAQNDTSFVIGSGYNSSKQLKSKAAGITMGIGSKKPTLFISRATGYQKTGKVAIGDVSPKAKLHIHSDASEDASLILEPGNPAANSTYIQLRDSLHRITVNPDGEMSLTSIGTVSISSNVIHANGNYYNYNENPSYNIEMGGTCMRIRSVTNTMPRDRNLINDWVSVFTMKPNGSFIFNGKVGVNIENTYQGYALAVDGGILTTKVHIQEVNPWPDYVFDGDYRLMPLGELKTYIDERHHLPDLPSEAEVKTEGYDVAEMQAALLRKIEELTLHVIRQQEEIDSLRTLVTVRFGYDACGNRVSRTLEFAKGEPDASPDGAAIDDKGQWQASLSDTFEGVVTSLFPNPTEGGFILSIGGEIPQGAKAVLCTIDGKVLGERSVNHATEEFDLGGMPAGIYLLRLASDRETKVWKVVKRN